MCLREVGKFMMIHVRKRRPRGSGWMRRSIGNISMRRMDEVGAVLPRVKAAKPRMRGPFKGEKEYGTP